VAIEKENRFKNIWNQIRYINDKFPWYYYGLILLVFSLPLTRFFTSVGQEIIILNWLINGNFKEKFALLKKQKNQLLIASIYLLHLLSLSYTSDFNWAFHDLIVKLPLLVLPVVIGTSPKLSKQRYLTVLNFFVGAVAFSTFLSVLILIGVIHRDLSDIREVVWEIAYIRLALFINLVLCYLCYLTFFRKEKKILKFQIVRIALMFWFVLFLIFLKSGTGLIVLFILIIVFLIWKFKTTQNFLFRVTYLFIAIAIPLSVGLYLFNAIEKFYVADKIDFAKLPLTTINCNRYEHDTTQLLKENGHYIWLFNCTYELKNAWNKRSLINFDSLDNKKQLIKYTAIRYLTSKNLTKDSLGVSKLSASDISNIENGMANYIYQNKYDLYNRIYEVLWEIEFYRNGGNPAGHSLTQRIVYFKIGVDLIKTHFWFGISAGDVKIAYENAYKSLAFDFPEQFRLRAHNQFQTFFISFGIIGFLWFMFAILYPVLFQRKWNDWLFITFFIIVFISMFNEDTLETQAGITFFAFFFAFYLQTPDDLYN